MYPASADFITAIKSEARHIHWSGSIGFDTPITFDDVHNIVSCNISKQISGQKLDIGTVYIGQITAELILPSVSRYELYGKTIETSVIVDGASDVIPMGIFTIRKATQTADHINITGYDNMSKFEDTNFSLANADIKLPYEWLTVMCTACGVELGSTSEEISALPNGNRRTGFADVVTDAKTWRDVLSYLGAYLGSYAYIGRDGKLYLGQYRSVENDTVPANFRGSSNLSDYRTTYNGIYNISKSDGLQEYVDNENEDGLVLDLGTNPFLQFTEQENRLSALQEIIDLWNGVYYVPYDAEIPLIPTYDVGDVLKFVDKQADEYDIGVITQIVYNSSEGSMTVKCTGDNPKLTASQDRFSKSVAGLSKDYNNGQETGGKNFWLLHTENTSALTVGNSKTQVAEIEWKQTVDVQRMGFMFTCDGTLSATAIVKVLITVDDSEDYEFEVTESKSMLGKRTYNSTCGYRVTGKGTHVAKVYMTVTDSALKWSDLK
jgi:hypothetical protein